MMQRHPLSCQRSAHAGQHIAHAACGHAGVTGGVVECRLACGRDIGEAFNLMVWLENACKVQVDVLGSHVDYSLPSDALATSMARRYMADGPVMSKYAALERRALLRKLDRESPSYRD